MSRPVVVLGEVAVAFTPGGVETAEGLVIVEGRVAAVGTRDEVLAAAPPDAHVLDHGGAAVVPGLHDAHLHLVEMARARRKPLLDHVERFDELVALLAATARGPLVDGWVLGRGWRNEVLTSGDPARLVAAVGDRPAYLTSHDGHSAWASPVALRRARVDAESPDPEGGRIERAADGTPTGLLRERAMDAVDAIAGRLQGAELGKVLDGVLRELTAWGITGATDAGDCTAEGGRGRHAALGDSCSSILDLASLIDARLRLTLNLPAPALAEAATRGIRTGQPVDGAATLRFGWAKVFADGALGSGTAALFEPDACAGSRGILRLEPAELSSIVAAGRQAGIGLAVHAIGDRAATAVLDALEGGASTSGAPPDRIEHAQLMRHADRRRLARLGLTASLQPIHATSDRDLAERCWPGRLDDAYAWRSLAEAGARIAFGSDSPVESADPWLGLHAAVRRHLPGDGREAWLPEQAIPAPAALAAYTAAPAAAIGARDEGHLRTGAVADLAVLDVDLATLLAADERLAGVRSRLTLVGGREVPMGGG